jgi:hypothetical protein
MSIVRAERHSDTPLAASVLWRVALGWAGRRPLVGAMSVRC